MTLSDGRRLFDQADLRVEQGEWVLLVGVSGSGKSTLLRLIAGIDEAESSRPKFTGNIRVLGAVGAHGAKGQVGLVFQSLALFDELSAVGNIKFAIDHAKIPGVNSAQKAESLLRRLHVPVGGRLSTLSGGERQRVAVARTLALDPPLLLFDEPTTGLDPARARAVAELIADTHRQSRRTVIVVTHDVTPFLEFNPRCVLLDSQIGSFREVTEAELRQFFTKGRSESEPTKPPADVTTQSTRKPPRRDPLSWIETPGRACWTLFTGLAEPFRDWRRPAWKFQYLWHYLRMVALGITALYVVLAGAMLGFVFVTFSFSNLPLRNVTAPLLTEEFLAATGYSMFRVVVPLMIAVLMAGKCGASAAADLGARRLTQQFEAMSSLGARPAGYLYGPLVIALALGTPLLTALGFVASSYAALVAYLMSSPESTVAVFQRNFFANLWSSEAVFPSGGGWVLFKAIATGIVIAGLAYEIGSRPKDSSIAVGKDVGLTIFWTSLGVLMLHSLFSFVEF